MWRFSHFVLAERGPRKKAAVVVAGANCATTMVRLTGWLSLRKLPFKGRYPWTCVWRKSKWPVGAGFCYFMYQILHTLPLPGSPCLLLLHFSTASSRHRPL